MPIKGKAIGASFPDLGGRGKEADDFINGGCVKHGLDRISGN